MAEQVSNVSLLTIGEKLKQARAKKGLTIDQAQKQTHIHSTVLAALEDGRSDEILTPMYVRSFLKKYAGHLGLDTKDILGDYAVLHPELQAELPAVKRTVSESKESVDASKFLYLLKFVAFLVFIIIVTIFLGNKVTGYLKKNKSVKPYQVVKYKQAAKPVPAPKKKPREKTAAPAVKPAVSSEPSDSRKGFSLVLKIKQPVLIQIKRDGVVLFKRVLPKDTVESLSANEAINIYVAKGEAIELILDGRPLGSPGSGIIKNLEVTRKGVRVK